jgi:hypothetical protein
MGAILGIFKMMQLMPMARCNSVTEADFFGPGDDHVTVELERRDGRGS